MGGWVGGVGWGWVGGLTIILSPLLPCTPPHHTTAPQPSHTPHPFTCSFPSAPTYRHPLQICTPPRLVFRGHCPFVALCLVGGGGGGRVGRGGRGGKFGLMSWWRPASLRQATKVVADPRRGDYGQARRLQPFFSCQSNN